MQVYVVEEARGDFRKVGLPHPEIVGALAAQLTYEQNPAFAPPSRVGCGTSVRRAGVSSVTAPPVKSHEYAKLASVFTRIQRGVRVVCLLASILYPMLRGQDQAAAGRPKIGVALEGGGALGLAHIGVLRWLEEHRIPVDFVAGTSMGGLVGGLYAMGNEESEVG